MTLRDVDDELHKLCHALTHVCKCSDDILERYMNPLVKDLLILLTDIMDRAMGEAHPQWFEENGALFNVLGVLNRFNYIESLSEKVASEPGIVTVLLDIIRSNKNFTVKVAAAEVIADLVVNSNKICMYSNLLEAIVLEVIMEATFQSSPISYGRETMRALQNLSYANANKVMRTANDHNMISALIMNLQCDDDELRRLSIGTIWNLSKDTEMKERVCDATLLILTQTLFDEDVEVRQSTVYTLRSFSKSNITATHLLNCSNLVEDLSHVISNDASQKMKVASAKILRDLSDLACTPDMHLNHSYFLEAVIQAASGCDEKVLPIIADILVMQTEIEEIMVFLINHTGIYEAISLIASINSRENGVKIDKIVSNITGFFESHKEAISDSILPTIIQVGLIAGSKSIAVDKFVLRILHFHIESAESTSEIAETSGVVDFLFECAKRMQDARWRVLALEILEILIISWREQYE